MAVLRTSEAISIHGRGAVRHALSRGRWQSPERGVVLTHNGTATLEEIRLIRLKTCAPGSALGGATALEIDGVKGFEATQVFVVLPEGADKPERPGLVTHWSTLLDDVDVHPLRTPRRTRPERSTIDLASWCASDRYARAAVIAAFQQGVVSERGMFLALERRGSSLRKGLVLESVLDAGGGIQSLPERDFDDLAMLAGLPRPTRQRRLQAPDGHFYLDVDWERHGVSVEIHGLPHLGVLSWTADLFRANEIVIAGPRLLIFTSYAVRHEQDVVLDQLVRALRAGGWAGDVRPDPVRRSRRRRGRPWGSLVPARRRTTDEGLGQPRLPETLIVRPSGPPSPTCGRCRGGTARSAWARRAGGSRSRPAWS